jgi:hypothetical protein
LFKEPVKINVMAKGIDKKIGLQKGRVSMNIIQVGIKQIADWKITKMKGLFLEKVQQGRRLYKSIEVRKLEKVPELVNLTNILISILGKKKKYKISNFLRKSTPKSFPLNLFIESPRTIAISGSKGIRNNLTKADLIPPLIDGGAASVEAVYLLLKGKISKRKALDHIINEASGSISSGMTLLVALVIIRALSYIPTPGRIAILIVAKIALKKLRNR